MSKDFFEETLSKADITLNGSHEWDLQVHDERLYKQVLAQGSIGLGEAYMDGWWDCRRLDLFFSKILSAELDKTVQVNPHTISLWLRAKISNLQSKKRAFSVGEKHYDIGNDVYKTMLDKRMVYTCGYFKNTTSLDKAQEAKLDLVCKKIKLKKGMHVLDIGCGWGSFAKYAAEKYGAKVTGVTVSKEQVALGKKLCKGLDVKFVLQDYRKITGKYDAVVSLGMFEHVGGKNYSTFMKVVDKCLNKEGLFLLHTIGSLKKTLGTDPWINKYIFPNGKLPCAQEIIDSANGIFVLEDWHNFGYYYYPTLMAWHKNFKKASLKYDTKFLRMWEYYLLSCAGAFHARKLQLWQIVFSKGGVKEGYDSVR